MAILNSPKTFMGAAVIDFNASAGWNSETSTCSVSLVEDPMTAGATHFDPANPGTGYIFEVAGLKFGGLLQQWTENTSVGSGKTYSVSLNSPTAALEGSQVIMNSYEGLIPIHNVFNPFGARENYSYGGLFGAAFTNSAGYPWGVLLQDIQRLVNTTYASGAFGGQYIRLGETLFKIDLSELLQLSGGLYWYRVSGTHSTILSVIRDVCEAASADFLVNMVGGDPDPVTGLCTTPPTIQIKVMPRHTTPSLGILSAYVNQAEADGILVSKEIGLEFGDTTTAKMVFGGPQSRMWENYSSEFGGITLPVGGTIPGVQIRPIWDIDQDMVTLGDHYNVDGNVSVRLSDGMTIAGSPFYRCKILELRCAMDSKETWETYASYYNPSIQFLFQQGQNLQAAAAPVNVILGNRTLQGKMQRKEATTLDTANTSSDAAKQWAIQGQKTIQDTLDKIYNSIRRTADTYYGKKFFVAVPFEPGGFSNNVKFISEDMDTVSAWEISNSAWVEPKPIADIAFYDGEGRLKPYATYPYGALYDYSNIGDNYTKIGLTVFVGPNPIGGKIVVRDINIEPHIHWGFFKIGGLPYAICTVPKVTKEDKFSVKGGLEALYKNAPAGYITGSGPHSTGFGSDVTNINIAPAAIIPTAVGVAQESTRHVYGPWWHQGGLGGKAEVEHDGSLKPETFGSTALMNSAGVAKAYATTMNLQTSESGEIELAELPAIGLGERIGGAGPYLSQISLSMSTSQVTTKYRFETWTLDFGKLAKYNSDRISRINKNTMRFLQEMRAKSKNPPLRSPNIGGGGGGINSKAGMGPQQNRYAKNTNQMIVADTVKDGDKTVNSVGAQPVGTTMSQIDKGYSKKFAMSQDGLFRPFVTVRGTGVATEASGVSVMFHESGILPSGVAEGKFSRTTLLPSGSIYPTASDLNPLFAGAGLHDFQAIARDKTTKDLNIRKGGFATSEYRGVGLRGPVVVTGWGYDIYRDPMPVAPTGNDVNLGGMGQNMAKFRTFYDDHMRESHRWKTGPLEMYWDEARAVWATRWEMVECRLIEDMTGPSGVQHPTHSEAYVIGSGGYDTGEKIKLQNRDPSLQLDVSKSTHEDHLYCIAIKIGGSWRPIYISCEQAPDDSHAGRGSVSPSPRSIIEDAASSAATPPTTPPGGTP